MINNNGLFILANASTTAIPNYNAAQAGLPTGMALRNVANNGTNWYLATDQGVFASTKNAGIFISADTGRIWVALNTGLVNLNIRKIFASSTDLYLVDAKDGLFQHMGSSWASVQAGLP